MNSKPARALAICGCLLLGGMVALAQGNSKMFNDDHPSAKAIERAIMKSQKAQGKSYKKYSEKLAKTIDQYSSAQQQYVVYGK